MTKQDCSVQMKQHPSKRPIRTAGRHSNPYPSFGLGPLTPGLQQKTQSNAIGFVFPNEGWADDTDLQARSRSLADNRND